MSDYVKELRKVVGNAPLLIPHAVTIVLNSNNEILFEVRSDDGFLDFPGGAIEIGEEIEVAAKRELFEETGVVANTLELFKVYSGEITHYIYKNGNEIYGIDFVFIVRGYSGDLKPELSEVNEVKYLSLNNVPLEKLSVRNKKIIEDLKASYFRWYLLIKYFSICFYFSIMATLSSAKLGDYYDNKGHCNRYID